jgi:hypothetical protein
MPSVDSNVADPGAAFSGPPYVAFLGASLQMFCRILIYCIALAIAAVYRFIA